MQPADDEAHTTAAKEEVALPARERRRAFRTGAVLLAFVAALAGTDALPDTGEPRLDLGVWGGLTEISLRDLYNSMDRWGAGMTLPGDPRETHSLDKSSFGYLTGLSAGYVIARGISAEDDRLGIAVRAGAVVGNRVGAKASIVNRNSAISGTVTIQTEQAFTHSVSYDPAAFPLQFGLTYSSPVRERYSLNAAAFAGPAFLRVEQAARSITNGAVVNDYAVTYSGTALAATFLIGGGWRMTNRLSINLDVALRYCKAYLKATSDAGPAGTGPRKGDPLTFLGEKVTVSLGGVGGVVTLKYSI